MGAAAGQSRRRYVAEEATGDEETTAESTRSQPRSPRGSKLSLRTRFSLGTKSEVNDFDSHLDFLRTIASPATKLGVYVDVVIAEFIRALRADRCSVYFVDEIRQEVWCVGALDCSSFRMPWDRGVVGSVSRSGVMHNMSDAPSFAGMERSVEKQTGYQVHTMLTIPVTHFVDETRVVGVIQVLNKRGGPFDAKDEREAAKISNLLRDSLYRQRWRAFETKAHEDSATLAMLQAHEDAAVSERRISVTEISASAVGEALESFAWPARSNSAGSCQQALFRSSSFNVFEFSAEELVHFVPSMLQSTGCIERCRVPPDKLSNWAWSARRGYKDTPYHNWFHGFQVMHFCYFQLASVSLAETLRVLDVFSLLVAALCHDLGHPGLTNSFLIERADVLALRYNDLSVLENYHAHLACELFRQDETAIGSGLNKTEYAALRQTVIRCILDTDMVHHHEMCQHIMSWAGLDGKVCETAEDRQFWLSICLHSADLSSQVLPWTLALAWENRISQEFSQQADQERALGLIPAPFMQFDLDDLGRRGLLQRNFIDFVMLPMWDPYTQFVSSLRPCYDTLIENRARYNHRCVNGAAPAEESQQSSNTTTAEGCESSQKESQHEVDI